MASEKVNFSNLNQADCKRLWPEFYAKSQENWEASKILQQSGKSDQSYTLLVDALEEYTKGLIVYFDSHGFSFRNRVEKINLLFRNHTTRHHLGFWLALFTTIGSDVIKALELAKENQNLLNKEYLTSPEFAAHIESWYIKRVQEIRLDLTVFSELEQQRQTGVHRDINPMAKLSIEHLNRLNNIMERLFHPRYSLYHSLDAIPDDTIFSTEMENTKKYFNRKFYKLIDDELKKWKRDTTFFPKWKSKFEEMKDFVDDYTLDEGLANIIVRVNKVIVRDMERKRKLRTTENK